MMTQQAMILFQKLAENAKNQNHQRKEPSIKEGSPKFDFTKISKFVEEEEEKAGSSTASEAPPTMVPTMPPSMNPALAANLLARNQANGNVKAPW